MAGDVSDAGRWHLSFGVGHETADVISSMSLELPQHAIENVSGLDRLALALPEASQVLGVL